MRELFQTDPSEDRDMLKRKKGSRARGTCEWICQTKVLNAWLHLEEMEQKSQPNSILWLHGNPGTGKSTMAIFLTEKLSTDFNATENMTLIYFFCDASFEKQRTATSIIRGFLYQLVQRHRDLLYKYILPKYKERGNQLFTSFDALWRIFLAAAADQDTGQKYCIIDALDECDNGSKDTLLCQLHETFHCQEKPPPNLSILITSRPYPEIGEYLQGFTNADLASFDQARQDIDRCIRERVDDLAKKKKYTDKVKREIIDLLMDKAEGTFLWVGLACEELRGKPSKDAIQFLRDMPKGLVSLYANLLNTATEDKTGECVAIRRILSFVVVSFEALTVTALSEACQLHQDEPDLDTRLQYTRDQIASCRLLVVVNDQKVQLLHQSVRDFLTGSGSGIFVERHEAHASIALRCIDNLIERFPYSDTSFIMRREDDWMEPFYDTSNLWRQEDDMIEQPRRTCSRQDFKDLRRKLNPGILIRRNIRRGDSSFPNYAEMYWTKHVREAGEKFKIREPQIPFFQTTSMSRMRWLHRRYENWRNYSLLNVAIQFGLPILVEYAFGMREMHPNMGGSAFNIKKDLDSLHRNNLSPLSCALLSHQIDWKTKTKMVNMLLKAGATVTGEDVDEAILVYEVDQEMALTFLDHMPLETRMAYIQKFLGEVRGCESKLMPSILAKYGDQVEVDEKVVNATVSSSTGMRILPLLLDQGKGRIAVTELIMTSAASNENQSSELIKFLLKHSEDQILITGNIIITAARNKKQGGELVELLLKYSKDPILITEGIMKTAVENVEQGSELVECLLKYQSGQISITENVMITAICNREHALRIIQLLYQHQSEKITVTMNILAAEIAHEQSGQLVELLLGHQGDEFSITENIILPAIYNELQGIKTIQLLCQHQSCEIEITTTILEIAMSQKQGPELLKLLLQHRSDQPTVAITAHMIHFGTINYRRAREHISAIFQNLGNSSYVLDDAMITAIKCINNCEEFIEFLIQEGGVHILITDEIVEAVLDASSQGYEHRIMWMEMFFKHQQKLKFSGKAIATIREFRQNPTRGE